MSDEIDSDEEITFYDLTNRDANRIYFNGLVYLGYIFNERVIWL